MLGLLCLIQSVGEDFLSIRRVSGPVPPSAVGNGRWKIAPSEQFGWEGQPVGERCLEARAVFHQVHVGKLRCAEYDEAVLGRLVLGPTIRISALVYF